MGKKKARLPFTCYQKTLTVSTLPVFRRTGNIKNLSKILIKVFFGRRYFPSDKTEITVTLIALDHSKNKRERGQELIVNKRLETIKGKNRLNN